MADEHRNFRGSLVLDFRKWWRHVETIYTRISKYNQIIEQTFFNKPIWFEFFKL